MADQIQNKDLFAKDAISKTTEQIVELTKAMDAFEETAIRAAKSYEKIITNEDNTTFKSVKRTQEAINALNTAEETTLNIRKERVKLNNRLAAATSDEVKRNTELKVIIQEQNKINKELAKESLGLTNAYQKQSKRLVALRKQYKSLVIEEGKTTKESKKLLKEIKKLDKELKDVDASAGQFGRNVGNYPETLGKATKGILGFVAAVGGAKLSLDGVKGSLESTAEGSENVRELTAKAGGAWDVVSNAVSGAVLDLVDYGVAIKKVATGELKGFQALGALQGNFKRTSAATENFGEKLLESADAQEELTKRIIAFEKSSRPLEVRVERLNGLIEQQQIIAGDSTRSFETLAGAVLKGQSLQVERARILQKLAKEELEIVQERIRIQNLSGGTGAELLDEETEAIKKLIAAENDLKNEVLENEKELRQIKQDRLEIDLDILIDGFDNQKTINERIIANEKETLKARAALLDETNRLAEESFRGQKEVLQELSAADIDVDELLLLDATELAQQIRLLEQSEIINTRTLEVIRERRIVIQDLDDAQQDLNDSQLEALEIQADILAQEEALGKQSKDSLEQSNQAIEDLDADRINNQKESLQRRLEQTKEGSIEELRLRQELNDLLLDEQKKLNDEELRLQEESLQQQKELLETSIEALSSIVDEGFSKRIAELEKELTAVNQRADILRAKANEGSLAAEQSLAVEEKRQAELEKEKQQERKRQEQAQAFFSVLTAFNKNDGDIGKTIADVTVLKALAGTLSAFDGVDDTGGRGDVDSKGGKIWTLHPNEQVWSKKDRGAVGFRSRDEIKNIVGMYDKGLMDNLMSYDKSNELINPSSFMLNGMSTAALESKMEQVNRSINSLEMPKSSMEADEMRNTLTIVTKLGNRKTKEVSKLFRR